jgi:predicted nuclease with TOPRIM domain
MSDGFPDMADRAHWRKLFTGQSVQLARIEVELKEQFDKAKEFERTIIKIAGDVDAALAAVGQMRDQVGAVQDQMDEIRTRYEKLVEHLKVRFSEMRAEMKHNGQRSTSGEETAGSTQATGKESGQF